MGAGEIIFYFCIAVYLHGCEIINLISKKLDKFLKKNITPLCETEITVLTKI